MHGTQPAAARRFRCHCLLPTDLANVPPPPSVSRGSSAPCVRARHAHAHAQLVGEGQHCCVVGHKKLQVAHSRELDQPLAAAFADESREPEAVPWDFVGGSASAADRSGTISHRPAKAATQPAAGAQRQAAPSASLCASTTVPSLPACATLSHHAQPPARGRTSVDMLLIMRPASVATANASGGGGSNMPAERVERCQLGVWRGRQVGGVQWHAVDAHLHITLLAAARQPPCLPARRLHCAPCTHPRRAPPRAWRAPAQRAPTPPPLPQTSPPPHPALCPETAPPGCIAFIGWH